MKKTIVLCETYREAVNLWTQVIRNHSSYILKVNRANLSLTFTNGKEYEFITENGGQRYLRGFTGDIIYFDEEVAFDSRLS